MLVSPRRKIILFFKGFLNETTSSFSPKFFNTRTSAGHYFATSYLVTNCGFSPENALKVCKHVCFETSQRPDSVLNFFRTRGFSNSQIHSAIERLPPLILSHPEKTLKPKFEFLLSKGASSSDIVLMVTRSPEFLKSSLQNHIIPSYRLLRGFLQSDERTIACVKAWPYFLATHHLASNVKLLLDIGATNCNIVRLLRTRPSIVSLYDLRKVVDEVMELGFDPSKPRFGWALLAKQGVTKSQWDAKVDAFKRWGWSEQAILEAFRKNPMVMLQSLNKINAVMSFWVNQLRWDSEILVKQTQVIGLSLEKRIIPRASVIQVLVSKGLMKKNGSYTPFIVSEERFLEKFVERFREETPQLLKLYKTKMNPELQQ